MKIHPTPALNPIRILTAAAFSILFTSAIPAMAGPETGWNSVPAILSRIKAPEFRAQDFNITEYGAKADGQSDCTEAIRSAIAACHESGGGRVVVPGGTFLTAPVHLKSGVNLHLEANAVLKFIPDFKKYLPVVRTRVEGIECMNYSPLIYAFGQENIAVTGRGMLDGSASWTNWWQLVRREGWVTNLPSSGQLLVEHGSRGTPLAERVFGDGHRIRPNFIQPYLCRNILIEGVTITNSPMWVINPVLSTNVTVRGVTVASHGPNNDGCDPDSSRDVLIEDCVFDTGDDCIAIKSGKDADGRRINVPSENIIVRRCVMKDGHGGVVLGSETSGGVFNVFAEDCTMDSPNLDRALRLKTNAERGGPIENVFFRNVKVGRVAQSILTIDLVYGRVSNGPFPPTIRNVEMRNVTAASSPRALWVVGTTNSIIENVRVIDSVFKGVEGPDVLTHSGSIRYENVTIEPAKTRGTPVRNPAP